MEQVDQIFCMWKICDVTWLILNWPSDNHKESPSEIDPIQGRGNITLWRIESLSKIFYGTPWKLAFNKRKLPWRCQLDPWKNGEIESKIKKLLKFATYPTRSHFKLSRQGFGSSFSIASLLPRNILNIPPSGLTFPHEAPSLNLGLHMAWNTLNWESSVQYVSAIQSPLFLQ